MAISKPLIELCITILDLYRYILIAWVILSWMRNFNLINNYHPLVQKIIMTLDRLTNPVLDYIRRYIPPFGGVDLACLILFLLLGFIKSVLIANYF